MPILGIANLKNHTIPALIILTVVFLVAFEVKSLARKFADHHGRRHSKIMGKADVLARENKYAEAAELYSRQAQKEGKTSVLAYSIYCRHAFEMWLKAGEPRKALEEAANIFWVHVADNGTRLKYNASGDAEKLTSWSAIFSRRAISPKARFWQVKSIRNWRDTACRCATPPFPPAKMNFPLSCSDCGANVFSNPYQDTARCDYCKTTIYPINRVNTNAAQTANFDISPHRH